MQEAASKYRPLHPARLFVLLRSPRAIFLDVYMYMLLQVYIYAFTGFNMSERCVYVCVILVNVFAVV